MLRAIMKTVDDVRALIDGAVCPLEPVRVPLDDCCGRRLAGDVRADADMPAFSRSAMDGFLLAAGLPPGRYRVTGEVRPGDRACPLPGPGEAVKVFTGSALPEEGAAVVMIEDTESEGDSVTTRVAAEGRFVRVRGSQARAGDVLLRAGAVITPGAMALLASVGLARPLVSPRVRVAHVVTGSELVEVGDQPHEGAIRDSNSPLILALVREAGAERVFHGRTSERVDETVALLERVDSDMILISGGASVGAHDGTRDILRQLGFTVQCDKVKSRPGKPLIFATKGAQVAFGLPGNPLSHFVCFQLFVRRALDRLAGLPPSRTVAVHLEDRPAPDARETWWPAVVGADAGRLRARPLPWRDSSDLTGLAPANALLRIGSSGTDGMVEALVFGRLAG